MLATTSIMPLVPTPDAVTVSWPFFHCQVSISDGWPLEKDRGLIPFTARSAFRTTASRPSTRATSFAGTLSPLCHISMRSRWRALTSGSSTMNVSSPTANAGKRRGLACSDMESPLPRSSFLYQYAAVATDERLSVGTAAARKTAAIVDTIAQSSFSVSSV